MESILLSAELEHVLGCPDTESICSAANLRRRAMSGFLCSMKSRGLCWRLLLGLFPEKCNVVEMAALLKAQVTNFTDIKDKVFPKLDRVEADPLSGLVQNAGDDKWQKFYKDTELCSFIKGDLDRLFMNGIPDSFFQTKDRREVLLSVLFVWAFRNQSISYRQGMHEIAGPILYCLEAEKAAWEFAISSGEVPVSHPLAASFRSDALESYLFWIFDRIMSELCVLYDPKVTSKGPESHPPVVHFCTRVQEHFLRELDPELCSHLEDNFVQAQLYGMRWCRLLFGREIPMSIHQGFRIWDYIFACAGQRVGDSGVISPIVQPGHTPKDTPPRVDETYTSPEILVNLARKNQYSPLLAVIADLMLAMLLHIREDLVEGDGNTIMCLLMRYPNIEDVTPILDLADMIRRGVLRTGAHMGASRIDMLTEGSDITEEFFSSNGSRSQQQQSRIGGQLWLANSLDSVKKMTERLSEVSHKVGRTFRPGGAGSSSESAVASTPRKSVQDSSGTKYSSSSFVRTNTSDSQELLEEIDQGPPFDPEDPLGGAIVSASTTAPSPFAGLRAFPFLSSSSASQNPKPSQQSTSSQQQFPQQPQITKEQPQAFADTTKLASNFERNLDLFGSTNDFIPRTPGSLFRKRNSKTELATQTPARELMKAKHGGSDEESNELPMINLGSKDNGTPCEEVVTLQLFVEELQSKNKLAAEKLNALAATVSSLHMEKLEGCDIPNGNSFGNTTLDGIAIATQLRAIAESLLTVGGEFPRDFGRSSEISKARHSFVISADPGQKTSPDQNSAFENGFEQQDHSERFI